MRQGYELNYPLMAVTTGQHPGPLPAQQSFFATQEDNVVITAIKKDADGDASDRALLRVGREEGRHPSGAAATRRRSLGDEPDGGTQAPLALDSTGKVLSVPTNPYEIKTVKVQFAKRTTSD